MWVQGSPLSRTDGAGLPVSFTSLLGAGSQEVNHIQMVADVSQDLEFGHQSFVLAGCGPLCVRSKLKSGLGTMGLLPPCPGGCFRPALLVCPCFIDSPTVCERANILCSALRPLCGRVSHRTAPSGGPGCADNVPTQSGCLTTPFQRLPF